MAEVSLLEVAVRRAGLRKGAKAVEVVSTWAIATAKVGHELGAHEKGDLSSAIREYAAYWKLSERTAWRDLGRFREVFPEEESPARLAALVAGAGTEVLPAGHRARGVLGLPG